MATTVEPIDFFKDVLDTKNLCKQLMMSPHYAKLTEAGVFAIVSKAKAVGIDPLLALDGGMYFVKGKVEMSAQMMNSVIRKAKHSVTKDRKSDDKICILHGKRSDTGDTWTESFSIEEAQKAGLLANQVWKIYPRDMLFARALSRLARQLFPDLLAGTFVEGEISQSELLGKTEQLEEQPKPVLSEEQVQKIDTLLNQLPDYKQSILNFMDKRGFQNYADIPIEMYDKIVWNAESKIEEMKTPIEAI